ncbi:MAG: hypothetical protein K9J51_03235, partial [Desulfotignum sp.]|nr:hypothetical protein [Desulfotignum sp.]
KYDIVPACFFHGFPLLYVNQRTAGQNIRQNSSDCQLAPFPIPWNRPAVFTLNGSFFRYNMIRYAFEKKEEAHGNQKIHPDHAG